MPRLVLEHGSIDILDYWTQVSLDAIWKEMVQECIDINSTGRTVIIKSKTGKNK